MEATPGIEPGFADLQSAASPLRHVASSAFWVKRTGSLSAQIGLVTWRPGGVPAGVVSAAPAPYNRRALPKVFS